LIDLTNKQLTLGLGKLMEETALYFGWT